MSRNVFKKVSFFQIFIEYQYIRTVSSGSPPFLTDAIYLWVVPVVGPEPLRGALVGILIHYHSLGVLTEIQVSLGIKSVRRRVAPPKRVPTSALAIVDPFKFLKCPRIDNERYVVLTYLEMHDVHASRSEKIPLAIAYPP